MVEIKEGAIFVADSHYPHHGNNFLTLLKKLENGQITTSQLFLMGDNFDLLFGHNEYIIIFSLEAISRLQRLSKKIEIHYFEGNHDFALSELFPHIHLYPRENQPIMMRLGEQNVALSHGDKYATGWSYNLYSKIVRHPKFITLLRPFERLIINHRISKLSTKKICHPFKGFEKRVEKILTHYPDADLVIEGHFHQAQKLGKYLSLPSQACQNQVAVVEEGEIRFKTLF